MIRTQLGPILAGLYFAICVLAAAIVALSRSGQELSGLGILILGLPWSLLIVAAAAAIGASSAWIYAIGMIASCGFNGWLLWRIGNRLSLARN